MSEKKNNLQELINEFWEYDPKVMIEVMDMDIFNQFFEQVIELREVYGLINDWLNDNTDEE